LALDNNFKLRFSTCISLWPINSICISIHAVQELMHADNTGYYTVSQKKRH